MEETALSVLISLLNKETIPGGALYLGAMVTLILVIRNYMKKNTEAHDSHRAAIKAVDTKVDAVKTEVHEIRETVSNIKGRMNL